MSSGNRLLHCDVLDTGLDEDPAARAITGAVVELAGVRLRVQDQTPPPGRECLLLGGLEQRAGYPAPARGLTDGEAAELGSGADEQQPTGAEHLAIGDRDQMHGVVIPAIGLLVLGDALLLAEDLVPEGQ